MFKYLNNIKKNLNEYEILFSNIKLHIFSNKNQTVLKELIENYIIKIRYNTYLKEERYNIYIIDDKDKHQYCKYNLMKKSNKKNIIQYMTYKNDKFIIINEPTKNAITNLVLCQDSANHQENVTELFRVIIKLVFLQRGMLILHSSCLVKNENGIGIIGNNKSGKTTTLVNMITNSSFDIVTNSELFIDSDNYQLIGYSLPMTIGLRREIVDIFPEIISAMKMYLEATTDEKVFLHWDNFSKIFKCQNYHRCNIRAFIIPVMDETVTRSSLKSLTLNEIDSFINERINEKINQYEPYWKDLFLKRKLVAESNTTKLNILKTTIPFFILTQNSDTNAHSVKLINELFEKIETNLYE